MQSSFARGGLKKGYVKRCTTHRFTLPPRARETKGKGMRFSIEAISEAAARHSLKCLGAPRGLHSTLQLWLVHNESENQNWEGGQSQNAELRTRHSNSRVGVASARGAHARRRRKLQTEFWVPSVEFWVLRAKCERVRIGFAGREREGEGESERRAEKGHAGGNERAARAGNERGNGASRPSATGARTHRQQARVIADTGGHRSLRRRTQIAFAQPLALEPTC